MVPDAPDGAPPPKALLDAAWRHDGWYVKSETSALVTHDKPETIVRLVICCFLIVCRWPIRWNWASSSPARAEPVHD